MKRIPSLNWLRVFEAAARCESFARAAEDLAMSAPAVSQQIRALETHLGVRLFERAAHSVHLTEAGRAWFPAVQQALASLEAATEGLFGGRREELLHVKSVLLFAHGILAPRIERFRDAWPDVALTLSTTNSLDDMARPDGADLRIVFGVPARWGLEGDALLGESLFPVARPAIAARITTPQDLLAETLIEPATHRAGWIHVLQALGVARSPQKIIYADSTIMASVLAAHGKGVALARAPASDLAIRMAGLERCLPEELAVPGTEQYHLACPDRAALRRPARLFRDWLLGEVAAV